MTLKTVKTKIGYKRDTWHIADKYAERFSKIVKLRRKQKLDKRIHAREIIDDETICF